MEQGQSRGARLMAQIDRHKVARMAPILLHRDAIGQRIHGVADHQVGIAKEVDECRLDRHLLQLVLAVGAVDDGAAVAVGEAVAVTQVGMVLQLRFDSYAVDFMRLAGGQLHEFDAGLEPVEWHREGDFFLLAA